MNGKREENKESSSKGSRNKQEEPHGHRNDKTDANKHTECIRDVIQNVATLGLKFGMQRVSAVVRSAAARCARVLDLVLNCKKYFQNVAQHVARNHQKVTHNDAKK